MSEIVGCIAMSHGPQLLTPPEKWPDLPTRIKGPFNPKAGIEREITLENMRAYSKRCDAAILALRDKIASWEADTIVFLGDDQKENILFDAMPAFTIFVSDEVDASQKYRYFGQSEEAAVGHYKVNAPLAMEMVENLMKADFDPAWSRETRYKYGLGHAFGRALKFLELKPEQKIVPVMVNTYYPPAPSAERCYRFGRELAKIVLRSSSAGRVAFVASGGLSHTKIDEALDYALIKALESNDTRYLSAMPAETLVSGTSEIRNWIAVAGAAGTAAKMVDYMPCYRNADGVGCAMGFAYWETIAA
jgi:3-O-methylgallate 3,4-dioxygenase